MSIFSILSFIGGLAMFLFGINYMSSSLEKLSGGKFEGVLEKLTDSRIKGVLLGAGVTAAIQSSTAVTVMAVGFVNSGIMTLHQVIGIIMGANVGTTITSWILSLTGIESTNIFIGLLKPSSFAPAFALVGIILFSFFNGERKRNVGSILLGFSILMFGMEAMSSAVAPLKDVPAFTSLLTKFSNPVLGLLAGTVLTAVIQSSSASVGILQALSVTGSVTVLSAFPIILGQNIGTCVTAILSSIGVNRNAKRTAVLHLIFNSIGVVIAMVIFYGVKSVVDLPFLNNAVNGADIAVIHTVFNLFSTILLFPFGRQLERLACLAIPDGESVQTDTLPEKRFLITPSFAISKVKERCDNMGALAVENISLCLELLNSYSEESKNKISENEKKLDRYEDELETYLVKISSLNLSFNDSLEISKLNHAIGNFERIGDYGANILKIKERMHKSKIHLSEITGDELDVMSSAVREIADMSVNAFINNDIALAMKVEPLGQVINNLKIKLMEMHEKKTDNLQFSLESGMLFFDIINSLDRIADHCSNLAVCIIELSQGRFRTHRYIKNAKSKSNTDFMKCFEMYLEKYSIDGR